MPKLIACIYIFIFFILINLINGSHIDNLIPRRSIINYGNSIASKLSKPLKNVETPCTCGIFLEGQIATKGEINQYENPIFTKEMEIPSFPCGVQGNRQCMKNCIDMIITFMPNLGPLVCSSINRDCVKERAYLFTKNCEQTWRNTGFYAGREFCCNNGLETKCRPGAIQKQQNREASILDMFSSSSNKRSIPEIFFKFVDRASDLASSVLHFVN